jgi:hypothetical protein
MDEEQIVDVSENDYPCACGHCTECGRNFVATPEELVRWAEEDAEYDNEMDELV